MNLAACGAARQREDFVMRLGCFLVTFAVLASLVLLPPKAKAFAMTSSTVTALAGGFLSACGLTPVVSGMGSSEEVNESVARLIQDFLNEEVGGISVADWALSFGEIGLAVKDKRIVIPKPFAEKLGEFARWVASKYSTKPGLNAVYSDESITFPDGKTFMLTTIVDTFLDGGTNFSIDRLGTTLPFGTVENPYIIKASDDMYLKFYRNSSCFYWSGARSAYFDSYPKIFDDSNTMFTLFICPPNVKSYSGYEGYDVFVSVFEKPLLPEPAAGSARLGTGDFD